MSLIIQPNVAPSEPIDKRVTLKTKMGEMVSAEFSLQDENGRPSAAEYIDHLYKSIKEKLGEVVIAQLGDGADVYNVAEIKKQILYIAAFHDSMFGTFNRTSKLPENERNDFIEIFLLAVATLIPGRNILVDLSKGTVGEGAGLN
ncbi:hypothetical protein CAP31_01080 [Sulfuriferula sp. AH1]|uniref:hypothetical protein n=1 Tax=Sulfuriferula sp. AH1 TaxID=1985873 RepID=UPI000B3B1EB4|nr:hypothetical protein [Sulfuriferula sp. AH1]ARU30408.1 hypothetical protein CAP31_01080 [Sulfuriferula sp. AH1]